MSDWHHHHDGDHRLVFCDGVDPEDGEFGEEYFCEEWDGPVCDGFLPLDKPPRLPCRFHLAFGEHVVDEGEQLVLVTHLEAVPEFGSVRPDGVTSNRIGPGV